MSEIEGEKVTPEKITAELKSIGVKADGTIQSSDIKKEEEGKDQKSEQAPEISVLESAYASDATELEATKRGWKADGELSAKEFIGREPLYEEIKKRGKALKDAELAIESFQKIVKNQEQKAFTDAKKVLEEEREQAIKAGNVDRVNEVDLELKDKEVSNATNSKNDPQAQAFLTKYKSYLEGISYRDEQIREFVIERDNKLGAQSLSSEKHFEILEQDLHTKFPELISKDKSNEETNFTPAVEGISHESTGTAKGKVGFQDLNSDQKRCARYFERAGVMKIDAYIKELDSLGEIKK